MWDIAKLYISACSNSVQLVPLQPIVIWILSYHYKELLECIREIEELEDVADDNTKLKFLENTKYLEEEEEEETKEMIDKTYTTLDGL